MQGWYLGCGKGVLFSEVSSIQSMQGWYLGCGKGVLFSSWGSTVYYGIPILCNVFTIPAAQGTQLHTNHRQQ